MGDLSKAVQYKGQKLQTNESKLFKLGIEENVNWKYANPNKIITIEEIVKMAPSEFLQNEKFINEKIKEGKVMTEADLKKYREKQYKNATSNSSGGSKNSKGHWVTIDGNHVLIE